MMSEIYCGPRTYQPPPSHHIGEVGERIDITATVERVTSFTRPRFAAEWQRERVYVVTMRDDDGNAIVSKSPSFLPQSGARVVIRCTIKEHSEWHGERQTVVFRVKERARADRAVAI